MNYDQSFTLTPAIMQRDSVSTHLDSFMHLSNSRVTSTPKLDCLQKEKHGTMHIRLLRPFKTESAILLVAQQHDVQYSFPLRVDVQYCTSTKLRHN